MKPAAADNPPSINVPLPSAPAKKKVTFDLDSSVNLEVMTLDEFAFEDPKPDDQVALPSTKSPTASSNKFFGNTASTYTAALPSTGMSLFDKQATRTKHTKNPTFGVPTHAIKGVSTCTLSGVSGYVFQLHTEMNKDALAWYQQKIPKKLVDLVAEAAELLPACMMSLIAKVDTSVQLFALTKLRWELAALSKGNRCI